MKKLLYHIEDEKKKKAVLGVCKELDIKSRALQDDQVNLQVGRLFGMTVARAISEPVRAPQDFVLPEMLIFFGMNDEDLDAFLDGCRAAKAEPVALKAVVTVYNMGWTIYMLAVELQKERDAIGAGV